MNTRKLLTGLAGLAIVLGACNSTPATSTAKGPDGALVKRADIKIEVVTHGQAIDGLLTLGPSVAKPALAAVAASGKPIHLATFDLSADVLTAIKDGKMDFAIDQQQFLQGYLPIVILTNYAETRNLPTGDGTGLIMTGPGFVTKDNAADVIALAAKGLR